MIKTNIIDVIRSLTKKVSDEKSRRKDTIIRQLVTNLKNATPVDTGKARDGWRAERGKIINDVEYITELNDGHSEQAPARFIEAVIIRDPRVKPAGIIVREIEGA
jgi:hypothetical protein